jgi:uncharacterized RDD family membrane protein YckC
MSQNWYFTQGGQQVGPVEFGQLQQMAASGQVGPSDLVWCEGMPSWVGASTIPGLSPGAQPGGPIPSMGYTAPANIPGAPGGLNYYGGGYAQPGYAGFGLRLGAFLLDTIISAVIASPFSIGAIVMCGGFDEYQRNPGAQAFAQIVGGVIGWLYYALQESSAAQATLGKRAVGIVVTDMNGQRIGFGQATGRYFGKILSSLICCIGYFMVLWTQQSQGLHDIMAGTLVIQKPQQNR